MRGRGSGSPRRQVLLATGGPSVPAQRADQLRLAHRGAALDPDLAGTLKEAKAKNLQRLEGKEYVVKDGDIIYFRSAL